MDDPAFMLLQLQENLQFMRTQFGAHVLSCVTHDSDGQPYWTYVLLSYDNYGNVQEYHEPIEGRAEWTNQPLKALKQLHLRVAGFVTKRLVHDCHPHLRTLAQQRYDEEVEDHSSRADNYSYQGLGGSRLGNSSSSTLRFASQRFVSDPPSYRTQDPNAVRPAPPSHETLSSGTRNELRMRQALEHGRTIQPQQLGPAHFPQPSPALGSEFWSSRDTNSQVYRYASVERSENNGTNVQDTDALPQSARVQLPPTQSQHPGEGVRSSASENTNPGRQLAHVNNSTISLQQEAQPYYGARSNLSGIRTQPDNAAEASRAARAQPSRSARNASPTPPWMSNMRNLRISPNSIPRPPVTTSALPEPLRSHPPQSRPSFTVTMDQETMTEFDEFRRRSVPQQRPNIDTLSRIEQEAAEFLNQDTNAVSFEENALASLAAQLGLRLPESRRLSSPASDKTVTAYDAPRCRSRRMTQRRYDGCREIEGPLPPPAPSPPLNSFYPANVPVHPPTLATSRSEAEMQRAYSTNNRASSSNNASMGRNVSFGEGSDASVVRRPSTHNDDHLVLSNSDEEEDGGRGIRRPSSQLLPQQSEGEQTQQPLPPNFNTRACNTFKAMRRKVSNTINSGKRFTSIP
ncbi:hypothetical protein KCU91_g8777, partial [Aureobasidium melanogenum]